MHFGQFARHRVPQREAVLLDGVYRHAQLAHGLLKRDIVEEVHLLPPKHVLRYQQPLAEVFPLELADEILPGYKAGDVDAVAEEVVDYRIDLTI